MIKNKKGFMLVEVIITSTVIVTSMILLYSSFQSLFAKYETRSNYHHIDALYASKEMTDYLLQEDFNNFINTNLDTNESIYLIKEGNCIEEIYPVEESSDKKEDYLNFCKTLRDLYSVNTMVFTSYDEENLKNIRNGLKKGEKDIVEGVKNETMKEYIDYVIGYYDIKNANIDVASDQKENKYSYFIMTEIEETVEEYIVDEETTDEETEDGEETDKEVVNKIKKNDRYRYYYASIPIR